MENIKLTCKYCGIEIDYGYLCRQCQDLDADDYYDDDEDDE